MKEHRRAERVVPSQQPLGELMLYVGEQCLAVKSVRDVSPFGIGVCIDKAISNESKIRMRYKTGADDVQVSGVVAWSALVAEDGSNDVAGTYRTGICLQPADVEANLEFYRLITRCR